MKKRMNSAVMIFAVICTVMLFAQCRSKEATTLPQGEVEVIDLCGGPEFKPDANYFRANATSTSQNQQMSKRVARTMALEEIATSTRAFTSGVIDIHTKEIEINDRSDLTQRAEAMIRVSLDEELNGARVICDRTTRAPDGRFTTYIAVELSGESVLNAIERRISYDEELRLDYNYERFKETFKEEMERLRHAR